MYAWYGKRRFTSLLGAKSLSRRFHVYRSLHRLPVTCNHQLWSLWKILSFHQVNYSAQWDIFPWASYHLKIPIRTYNIFKNIPIKLIFYREILSYIKYFYNRSSSTIFGAHYWLVWFSASIKPIPVFFHSFNYIFIWINYFLCNFIFMFSINIIAKVQFFCFVRLLCM